MDPVLIELLHAASLRATAAGLVLLATDTHYADYGAWDGYGAITLHIDHGSDGIIDETVEIDNHANVNRVYLPLAVGQH